MQKVIRRNRWLAFFMAVLMVFTTVGTEGLTLRAEASQQSEENGTEAEMRQSSEDGDMPAEEAQPPSEDGDLSEEGQPGTEDGDLPEEGQQPSEEEGQLGTEDGDLLEEEVQLGTEDGHLPEEVLPEVEDNTISENSYTVMSDQTPAYTGTVETWEGDGQAEQVLAIRYWDVPEDEEGKQVLSNERVMEILQARGGETFDVVNIELQSSDSHVVEGNIVNAAASLLNADYEERRVVYAFFDSETGSYHSLAFYRPGENIAERQIDMNSIVQASLAADGADLQGVQLSYTKPEGGLDGWADMVELYVDCVTWMEQDGEEIVGIREEIFGGRDIPVKLCSYVSGEIISVQDNWVWCGKDGISIANAEALDTGSYLVLCCAGNEDQEDVEPIQIMEAKHQVMPDIPDGVTVWKSLSEDVVTIGEDGEVIAKGEGYGYLYAGYTVSGQECFKLYRVQVMPFRGEIWDDGGRRLIIHFGMVDEELTKDLILKVLVSYKEEDEFFDVVELDQCVASGGREILDKDIINAMMDVLNPDGHLDCNFDDGKQTDPRGWILEQPHRIEESVDVTGLATVSLAAPDGSSAENQGIRIKLNRDFPEFPADSVGLYLDHAGWMDRDVEGNVTGIREDIFGGRNLPLRVFKLSSGQIEDISYDSFGNCGADYVCIDNMQCLEAGQEYLALYCTGDGTENPLCMKEKKTMVLPDQPSGAVWQSFSPEIARVDGEGKVTAYEPGEAFFCARYEEGGVSGCLKMYRVEVMEMDLPDLEGISFNKTEATINLEYELDENGNRVLDENGNPVVSGEEWLQVIKNPWDVDLDIGDTRIIKWSSSDPEVAAPRYYEEEDGEGNIITRCDGQIIGKKAGAAEITASCPLQPELPAVKCKITVRNPIDIGEEDMPELFAVLNFDQKLGDIPFPQPYQDSTKTGWKWLDETTSLAPYKGMNGSNFTAVYSDGNRSAVYTVWVEMYTLEKASIIAFDKGEDGQTQGVPVPASAAVGDTVSLGYALETNHGDWTESRDYYVERYGDVYGKRFAKYAGEMRAEWTSKPANAGTAASKEPGEISYAMNCSKESSLGKKEITLTVKDRNGKTLLKDSSSIFLTPMRLVNFWDEHDFRFEKLEAESVLHIQIRDQLYEDMGRKKLTFASTDNSVIQLDIKKMTSQTVSEREVHYRDIKIPYISHPGTAGIRITAADEAKSSAVFMVEFTDREPKIEKSAVTINKASDGMSTTVTVLTRDDTRLDIAGVRLKDGSAFKIKPVEQQPEESGVYQFILSVGSGSVKNGKHTETVMLPVSWQEVKDSFEAGLKISVEDKTPKVICKQTVKVNTFYQKDHENVKGMLTVTASGADIAELTLADCDFTLQKTDVPDQYAIVPTKDNPADQKGVLKYKLNGYAANYQKNITVGVKKTKTGISLSAKSDTLYPLAGAGYKFSTLRLYDKKTGKATPIVRAVYVKGQDEKEIPDADKGGVLDACCPKNNMFALSLAKSGTGDGAVQNTLNFVLSDRGTVKYGKTDTFRLKIWGEGWAEPVSISYAVKVDKAQEPKLKLNVSTLTFNKNEKIYRSQQAAARVSLGGSSIRLDENTDVVFTGKNLKSENAIKSGLILDYRTDTGQIVARFDQNKRIASLEKGTYSYSLSVMDNETGESYLQPVSLKVKVVDSAPEQCVKVTGRGSIDVLDREDTAITCSMKLNNLAGEIVGVRLDESLDGCLFDCSYEEGSSTFQIKATSWNTYSTNKTYQVKAVFRLRVEDYDEYEVASKVYSFKVRQGSPKITASTDSDILYSQLSSGVKINFTARLNQKNVKITNVRLLDYFPYLEVGSFPVQEEDGSYTIRLHTLPTLLNTIDENFPNDGKFKLGFIVDYKDAAGNIKGKVVPVTIYVK